MTLTALINEWLARRWAEEHPAQSARLDYLSHLDDEPKPSWFSAMFRRWHA